MWLATAALDLSVSHPFPGVNFIIILLAAFACADPKSAKKTYNLTVFFAILGSAHVKAACKMLMKLIPGRGS